jgi:uncharacterized protein
MKKVPESIYEAPSWSQINKMLQQQAAKIQRSCFQPDIIVGVCRGGWVPARILSDLLRNSNLASVKAKKYLGIGKAKSESTLTQPLSTNVLGKKVLIVDDVADSGDSLKLIINHAVQQGAKQVKTATIYFKPCCRIKPDYFEQETSSWIVFPWEIKETLKEIQKSKNVGVETEKLIQAGVPKRLVIRLLKELSEKST